MWRWRTTSLTFRLTGAIIVAITILLLVIGVIQLVLQERYTQDCARINGLAMSETLFGALHSTMLANDRAGLHRSVRTIAERAPNVRVRIFNKGGVIVFSSVEGEQGQRLDARSEACFKCHREDKPIEKLPPGDRTRTFESAGVPSLGIIRPIENEPVCSQAPCHAHPPSKRLLGVLDVTLGLTQVERSREQTGELMMGALALAMLVVAGLVILIVRRAVHRPIRSLADTLQAVGSGDYSARYAGADIAEFSYLGEYTNRMAQDLERANGELVEWTQTLEKRVDEKTAELREAQNRMVRVERMAALGKLAAVVAHEINNPLASVVTYAKLLVRRFQKAEPTGEASPENLKMLEAIASESYRCGEIVSNLLLLSPRAQQRAEPTDVNKVVERALFIIEHKLSVNGIKSDVELNQSIGLITVDPNQIQQAALALFINAIEAMPEGGLLTVRTQPAQDGGVRLEVRDDGVGMDEEVKRKVFEPFFTTKGDGKGTGLGLGLAVVYGIVQRHRGTIDIESALGEGTCFLVNLPANGAQIKEGA